MAKKGKTLKNNQVILRREKQRIPPKQGKEGHRKPHKFVQVKLPPNFAKIHRICQSSFHKRAPTFDVETDNREAPVRFGSVTVWEGNGSSGSGFRFQRFLFKKGLSVFQYSLTRKNGSGSGFGSWKTVPAVPVPLSVSGKMVPTVPVPVSDSVPEPPCNLVRVMLSSDRGDVLHGLLDRE